MKTRRELAVVVLSNEKAEVDKVAVAYGTIILVPEMYPYVIGKN